MCQVTGQSSKTRNHVCIWSTMPWYGLQQAGTFHVGNRLLILQSARQNNMQNFKLSSAGKALKNPKILNIL